MKLSLISLIVVIAAGCATNQRAAEAFKSGDCKTALNIWLPKAKAGDVGSQHNMGILWWQGCPAAGIAQNLTHAANWWALAAKQGAPESFGLLGALYYDGKGVPQDKATGLSYMRFAARWDIAQARVALARIGVPVPEPDLKRQAQAESDANRAAVAELFLGLVSDVARARNDQAPNAPYSYAPPISGSGTVETTCLTSSQCPSGQTCIRPNDMSRGLCGRSVDNQGAPTFPGTDRGVACRTSGDCPMGFRCSNPANQMAGVCTK